MPTPRLQDLDPIAVALDVERAVIARFSSLALELSPGVTVVITGDTGTLATGPTTNIGLTVLDLVVYAQTGRAYDKRPWHEYATSLFPLHSTMLADGVPYDGVQTTAAGTRLGVAMCAAFGRDLIAEGRPIEAKHMYVLGGLTQGRFSQLQSAGDAPAPVSRRRPAQWAASDARAWLAARGVPGMEGQ